MSKRGCLLLDIDNTLVNRDAAFRRYMLHFIDRNAHAFSKENIAQAIEDILTLDCGGRKERSLFCRELLRRFPLLPYTEEALWTDHQRLPEFVLQDLELTGMLERLSASFHLLIISNGSSSMQRRKLQRAGLSDFFEHVGISGEVGHAKPDPALFSHALQFCDHPAVVMIGDDYINDIEPAVALQLKTIFVNAGKAQMRVKPDREIACIHSLEEALDCLI